MGRCYEFGVEIHAGCEHAMVVTAEGGACECKVCSTVCPGRFAGCAAVVAIPGRVPPSAPAWATPGAGESDRRSQPGPPRPHRPSAEQAAGRAVRQGAPPARRAPEPSPPAVGLPAPQPTGNGVRATTQAPAQAPVNGPLAEVLTLLTKLVEEQAAHPTAVLVEVVEGLRDEVRDRDEQLATSLEHYAAYQRQLAENLAHVVEAVDKLAAVVADDLQRLGVATERLAAGMTSVEEKLSKPATLRDLLGRRT